MNSIKTRHYSVTYYNVIIGISYLINNLKKFLKAENNIEIASFWVIEYFNKNCILQGLFVRPSMKKTLLLFLLLCITTYSQGKDPLKKFFRQADTFFKTSVVHGKVDYENILMKPAELENLLLLIEDADLSTTSEKERRAFYINSYNLLVIKTIIIHYPVRTPLEIEGFYSRIRHKVGKEDLTLDQIHQEKLLGKDTDLRSAFALCNGTKGSFPLSSEAFQPGKLNRQLNRKIRECANDMNFVRIKSNSSLLLLCESFQYSLNIAGKGNIVKILNQFRKEEVPGEYLVDVYPGKQELNILFK